MIVNRLTFRVKYGRWDEALKMLKESRETEGRTDKDRIYSTNIGPPFNTLLYDLEFENLSEMEAYWADWWSNPDTPAFMEKWNALVETGGHGEVWTVE